MEKMLSLFVLFMALAVVTLAGYAQENSASGENLFKKHCAICHPDGGNIVNPKFTLHKKDLDAHNIRKPGDIVNKMRNPGPGMPAFDEKTVPGKDAQKIAEYILKTFK